MAALAPRAAMADVQLPSAPVDAVVALAAREAWRWEDSFGQTVWWLAGDVAIEQEGGVWRGAEAIVWVDQPASLREPTVLTVYVEGARDKPVRIELYDEPSAARNPQSIPQARQQAPHWYGKLRTIGGVEWRTPTPSAEPATKPGAYARGLARRGAEIATDPVSGPTPPTASVLTAGFDDFGLDDRELKPLGESPRSTTEQALTAAQYVSPFTGAPITAPSFGSTLAPTPGAAEPPNRVTFRTVEVAPRMGAGLQAEVLTSPTGEDVAVLSGGVRVVITGVQGAALPTGIAGPGGAVDRVEIETDRAVIWTRGGVSGTQFSQSGDKPLEFYLEGNIVLRQGERTIYAERMYYDARRQTGVILDAELLTPLPQTGNYQYRGLVRLKAESIRQLDESRFVADKALFTTSRIEEPGYSLRSDTITFEDYQAQLIDPATGQPATDPFTGAPQIDRKQLATSEGNRVFLDRLPVLYWPTIATDLTEPAFYIRDFRIRNDSIFGTQVLADFDVYQLLGRPSPPGTDWTVGIDYLSERGLGYGTVYEYNVNEFAGFEGPAFGSTDLWFIDENGNDNLGFGRRNIVPEQSFRGRAYWNHRQQVTGGLLDGWEAQGEVGWVSDRTFLEQYYEQEWDERGDQPTGARFRRRFDNQSITIEANAKLNDFFTETQELPRVDHWLMGQDVFDESMTWFAHSKGAYSDLNPASTPTNATLAGQFAPFPWEAAVEGERFSTRHEFDLPLDFAGQAVPVKVVPYVLGEVAHWGADLTGDDVQRAYVHTGVRASLPMWAVNPNVRDPLFNLNGLAHKVVYDAEVSYTDSSQNYEDLPLYDPIEDNALEEIRRRLFFTGIPAQQDPRFYLIRSGQQGWVASPVTELVDDQRVARLGMRNRLQTKRGAPGQERVIDWLTLDTNVSLFPSPDDNLGENVGLADYDLAWHLGDRLTFLSDGFVDLFDDGLRTFSAGVSVNRPARGNFYVGYRSIAGPFESDLVTGRFNYRLGPKWIASASAVVDFGDGGNIGQAFSLSHIGESLLFTLGANVDESKDNVGLSFLLEPRFLPKTNLTRRTGIDVPPAGAFGIE
ncbi:MAG: organic solvent tolerance protein OstA [Lacipirellulaceae bacterium]